MKEILASDFLPLPEIEVLEMALKWCKHYVTNSEDVTTSNNNNNNNNNMTIINEEKDSLEKSDKALGVSQCMEVDSVRLETKKRKIDQDVRDVEGEKGDKLNNESLCLFTKNFAHLIR